MKKKHKRMNMGGMTNDPRPMPAGPQPDPNPARPGPPEPMAMTRTSATPAAKTRRGFDLAGLKSKIMDRVGSARKIAEQRRGAAMERRAAAQNSRSGLRPGANAPAPARPETRISGSGASSQASPNQKSMIAGMSSSPPAKQSFVGTPPPNMQQMTQNAMAQFKSMPGAASQSSPTQRSMISGMSSSPPVGQSFVGSPPPNMGQRDQNAMAQFNSMNNSNSPKLRGGGLAKRGKGAAMKGGGLARKGVGQALKAGGAVRACGAAQRGKTKGKMV